MSAHHGTVERARLTRTRAVLAACLLAGSALAGCSAQSDQEPVSSQTSRSGSSPDASASAEPQATVSTNLPGSGAVPVDHLLEVDVTDGSLDSVEVTFGKNDRSLEGELAEDGSTWAMSERLEPGTRYTVRAEASDDNGLTTLERTRFRTEDLSLDQQTYPSIAPLDGETVGVGMPVIISFDVAVTDRAAIERHLSVESSPRQVGSWHWISDNEVHWRPKVYWKPGTQVTVNADINSVPAGDGIYGQLSRSTSFEVGDAVVSRIDVANHQMKVFRNGTLLRTLPISAGKPGFTTRSGTKVIIEKFRSKRMDAATTGISEDDPEYYDLEDVEYAMRVTYSGEFLHAAPWSVGSQGNANVSHGCVGMSTADAGWIYNLSKRGDVVEVTGTDRQMTLSNGYGDWNASFADYRAGSAL